MLPFVSVFVSILGDFPEAATAKKGFRQSSGISGLAPEILTWLGFVFRLAQGLKRCP